MKVEFLEKVMHGRGVYDKGDVATVKDSLGVYFCSLGWAKDTEGNVATGQRRTDHVTIAPDNVANTISSQDI